MAIKKITLDGVDYNIGVEVDATLSEVGEAADAKATGDALSALEDEIADATVSDGSITTAKIANNAVTMDKTDFYAHESVEIVADWITKSYQSNTIPVVDFPGTQSGLSSMIDEMPDVVSIVMEVNSSYWTSGNTFALRTRSSNWTYYTFPVEATKSTITANGKQYGIAAFTKSNFISAYQNYVDDITNNNHIAYDAKFVAGNNAGRFVQNGLFKVVSGTVTSDMIESGFITTVLSPAFVSAVNAAIESGDEDMSYEEVIAKNRLTGKVFVALGDSYTHGLASQLSAIATKYGMAMDNRGVVSSSICGTWSASTGTGSGYRPMWQRADTIVSDYTSGYTIDGTSYTVNDVGVLIFMGGANDGFGIATWIGEKGLADTDTAHIYGACHHIFSVLAEAFPKAKIICITQPSSYSREVSSISDDATAQTLGFVNLAALQVLDDVQFSNYAMAIKEEAVRRVATSYQVPILDMFAEFPTMMNPENRSKYWASDKLHMSADGNTLLASAIEKKIVKVIVGS